MQKVQNELITARNDWVKLRDSIIADDVAGSLLTVLTRNFANRNRGAVSAVRVPKSFNEINIMFLGAPADHTTAFAWRLYGYRGENGPAQNIAYGTGNLGDVAVTVHPITGAAATGSYYADYLAITAQVWPATVTIKDVGGASGEIAIIAFDGLGIEHLRLEMTAVGGSNEPTALEALMTGL